MSKKDDINISVEKINKLIGYKFKNTRLLIESFTHKSISENNYERLEFLGDAVLQLIITKNLYITYPDIDEGTLSREKQSIVSKKIISKISLDLKLIDFLIAKNLGIPAIIVASGLNKSMDDFINGLHLAYDSFKEKEVEPHWDRLKLRGERYFNAGVLLIDYQKWLDESISDKLYQKLVDFKDILLYWDQDVMNMVIDDKFLEINPNLNFDLYISTNKNNLSPLEHFGQDALDDMSLLHYTGSIKPWTVRGSFNKKARYFHDAYYELFGIKYLIKNSWRVASLTELFKGILKLHIKNLRYPFSFIFYVLKSFIKPVSRN